MRGYTYNYDFDIIELHYASNYKDMVLALDKSNYNKMPFIQEVIIKYHSKNN